MAILSLPYYLLLLLRSWILNRIKNVFIAGLWCQKSAIIQRYLKQIYAGRVDDGDDNRNSDLYFLLRSRPIIQQDSRNPDNYECIIQNNNSDGSC